MSNVTSAVAIAVMDSKTCCCATQSSQFCGFTGARASGSPAPNDGTAMYSLPGLFAGAGAPVGRGSQPLTDRDKAVGIVERQSPQHDRVHDGEDRGRGADAEREDEERDDTERG